MEKRIETMKEVFEQFRQEERDMVFRHPWFNLTYNWLVVALLVALSISFVIWGVNIRTQRRADEQTAIALATYQAEQKAIEEERMAELEAATKSAEAIKKAEAEDAAKALYGIRNFISKYGYQPRDLRTYVRCMIDRVEYGNGVNDLHAIIAQEAQFLGYSEKNPVLEEYFNVAMEEIEKWHTETTKPWDASYRFAELTESGVFLTNEFGADGYARRVRYER